MATPYTSFMKKISLLSCLLLSAAVTVHSQTAVGAKLSYEGMYIAKTGGVPAAKIEIFTYLRFYDDGAVVLQAVTSNDPESVGKWFGRDKKFSQKGTYQIKEGIVTILVNNKGTSDAKLEGAQQTSFKGSLKADGTLCLLRDKELEERCFVFAKLSSQ